MSNEEEQRLKSLCSAATCSECGSVEVLDEALKYKNHLLRKVLHSFAKKMKPTLDRLAKK